MENKIEKNEYENCSMSALVLIDKNQKLLFQLRPKNTKFNPNKWGFFGGKFEANKTKEQALIREMKEEINLNLENKNFKFIKDYYYKSTHCFFFYCIISEKEKQTLKLQEGQDWVWTDLCQALELDHGTVSKWNLNFLNNEVKQILTKEFQG